jgi:hypothetical protein
MKAHSATQVKTIGSYLKQAEVRQENVEELRKKKTTPERIIRQAEQDVLIYTMIAHTMALENDRLVKEGGKTVYQ